MRLSHIISLLGLSFFMLSTVPLLGSEAQARKHGSDSHVRGYTKKDGTHVQPHHRTTPNRTKRDNYSSLGNTNPYTGKPGTIYPDR